MLGIEIKGMTNGEIKVGIPNGILIKPFNF